MSSDAKKTLDGWDPSSTIFHFFSGNVLSSKSSRFDLQNESSDVALNPFILLLALHS